MCGLFFDKNKCSLTRTSSFSMCPSLGVYAFFANGIKILLTQGVTINEQLEMPVGHYNWPAAARVSDLETSKQ